MPFASHKRFFSILLLLAGNLQAQTDSVVLPEVTVGVYLSRQRPLLRLPASVARVDSSQMQLQHGQSFVPVLNAVPGVRMEERSPGSYRLSLRGSVIRAPFGVRNVKIYLDDFPLTNAGGETYLNIIDLNAIHSVELIKGPDGSLFGANSGGVVQLNTRREKDTSSYFNFGTGAGSYGLFRENFQVRKKSGKQVLGIDQAWQRSDGYRQHSQMDRKFFMLSDKVFYGRDGELSALFFYSDHFYETPGGLNLQDFSRDPRLARPSTLFTPGAAEQNASIRNRTFFGGATNKITLGERSRYVLSLFGSQTFFENPFITNYEERDELNVGARSWFELSNKEDKNWRVISQIGGEFQEMNSSIRNYGNQQGIKDSVLKADDIDVRSAFAFVRLQFSYRNKTELELSSSYNFNSVLFTPLPQGFFGPQLKVFNPQVMPRAAFSYFFVKRMALRLIASRGYSPPGLQEIRASNTWINASLQPESGWNYEGGIRLSTKDQKLWWDISAFYFALKNSIVRKVDADGLEYFENAVATDQRGIESSLQLRLMKHRETGLIRHLDASNAFTFSDFVFSGGASSGNSLPGVPRYVAVSALKVGLPAGLYFFGQHYYSGVIWLDDNNNQKAEAYHLLQLKLGWSRRFLKVRLTLHAGVDNLLNEPYSLGNDLNAFGGRYYNAAPARNYFGGINVLF